MSGTRLAFAFVLLAVAAVALVVLGRGGSEDVEVHGAASVASPAESPVAPAREGDADARFEVARAVERDLEASHPDDALGEVPVEDARFEVVVVVQNETGAVLAGIDVVAEPAYPVEERTVTRRDRKGFTDDRGRCRLRLFEGEFWIGANRRESAAGLTTESALVEIAPGSPEFVLTLRRKAASVHVVCVDDRDAPVEGVEIEVGPDKLRAMTSAAGRVTFEDVPVGRQSVRIRRGKKGLAWPPDHRRELDLAVGARELVRFRMSRDGVLVVRFVPAPPPGVRVKVRAESADDVQERGHSGPDGEFSLGVAPGIYRVSAAFEARSRLHAVRTADVTVRPADRAVAVVPIREYDGLLSGQVVDPRGRPVPGAYVEVRDVASGGFKWTWADGEGRFELRGLPDLALDLWACREHLAPRPEPLLRLEGPREGAVIRLGPVYDLEGSVSRPPGDRTSLANVPVFLSWTDVRDAWLRGVVETDLDDATRGTFRFRELAGGTYQLRFGVSSPEDGPPTATFILHAGSPEVTRVHVTLSSSGE